MENKSNMIFLPLAFPWRIASSQRTFCSAIFLWKPSVDNLGPWLCVLLWGRLLAYSKILIKKRVNEVLMEMESESQCNLIATWCRFLFFKNLNITHFSFNALMLWTAVVVYFLFCLAAHLLTFPFCMFQVRGYPVPLSPLYQPLC